MDLRRVLSAVATLCLCVANIECSAARSRYCFREWLDECKARLNRSDVDSEKDLRRSPWMSDRPGKAMGLPQGRRQSR